MKQEKKKESARPVITGMNSIEKYVKRSAGTLMTWKSLYAFPLEKVDGEMVLYLDQFDSWCVEWCFDPGGRHNPDFEKLLLARSQEQRLAALDDYEITGHAAMAAFAGRRGPGDIIGWIRDYSDWPGSKNADRQPTVRSRDFQLWLESHGFRRSVNPNCHHGVSNAV